MAKPTPYERYKNLKKAEIYLEKFIYKYVKEANPKSKEDIKFHMKRAEEALFGRQGKANIPKEVMAVIRSTRGTSGRTAGASFFLSASQLVPTLYTNIGNRLTRQVNRQRLKTGKEPFPVGKNLPLRIPVGKESHLRAGGNNIIALLEAIRQERWNTEDVMGTRLASDVTPDMLAGLNLDQKTFDSEGTNIYWRKEFDSIKHAKRIKQERDLFARLQKGNASYDNVFYLSGDSWRSQIDSSSPNYHVSSSGKNTALSIGERKAYDANRLTDPTMGKERWSGRGSGRSYSQANDDTRAYLIGEGADEKQVNRLSDDVLSRFRISGGIETDNNIQLLNDNGRSINLKLGRNSLKSPSGRVYEGTTASKDSSLTIKKEKKPFFTNTGKLTFSDPLE